MQKIQVLGGIQNQYTTLEEWERELCFPAWKYRWNLSGQDFPSENRADLLRGQGQWGLGGLPCWSLASHFPEPLGTLFFYPGLQHPYAVLRLRELKFARGLPVPGAEYWLPICLSSWPLTPHTQRPH